MDEIEKNIKHMADVAEKVLSNIPTAQMVAAAREDIVLLLEYAEIVEYAWRISEENGIEADTPRQLQVYAMLSAAYTMGYRKGRAATPLTLVVAPEQATKEDHNV